MIKKFDENVYKTEETPIGIWEDGRVIYRRVLDYSDSSINVDYITFTDEFNPDYFIKMDALGIDDQYNNVHRAYLYSTTSGMSDRSLYYEKDTHRLYTTGRFPIWYIVIEYVKTIQPGAFRNAAKLEKVYIPESVKFIGAESFRFTALKTVKIAADCEYSETSFPEGCKLEFYENGETYGQLYDCDGYAVLDCEAARIYVK